MLISNIIKNIAAGILSGVAVWIVASYINVLRFQMEGGTDAAWNIFNIALSLV